jgi:hypothetical protein
MNGIIGQSTPSPRVFAFLDRVFGSRRAPPLKILIYQRMWGAWRRPPVAGCKFMFARWRWKEADAIVFHIPQLRSSRFPPRKLPGQIWVAWSLESEAHYPMLARRNELRGVFDLWMTYQQDSDIWCPYLEGVDVASLQAAPGAKGADVSTVAVMSSPVDQSGRTALLESLMREMPIDSYGKIFCNRPGDMKPGRAGKLAVLSRYKFTLAFENSICRDYVTEKFFDPLIAGSVPVYLGAPNVDELAPGDNCYIDASRFENPRALAAYLLALAKDDEAYARYLAWKGKPLRPRFLRHLETASVRPFQRLADCLRARQASQGGANAVPNSWPAR